MNKYFTEVKIKDLGWKIDHRQKILLVGSCFTENIGQRMQRLKFQVDLNPFGILYNPQSIAKSLQHLIDKKVYAEDDLFEQDGIWHSFDHHSRFSSSSAEKILSQINEQIDFSAEYLRESEYLILSFGTAWIYELKETGETVSNCHKLPAAHFKRFRLSPEEIVENYKALISSIWKINPNLKIIFTVSPIRHWKDGAVENQLSKATLLLAIDTLVKGLGESKCTYFPSYEIMMDELRDYRFYSSDMMHVSPLAIDHIWQKFEEVMISEESTILIKKVLKIIKAKEHRVLKPEAEAYEKFMLCNLNEINYLLKYYPFLDMKIEKNHFEIELNKYRQRNMK